MRARVCVALHSLMHCASLVLNATLVFFAEQTRTSFNNQTKVWIYTATGQPTPFQSIYAAFWWAFTTLMFFGYGMAPVRA